MRRYISQARVKRNAFLRSAGLLCMALALLSCRDPQATRRSSTHPRLFFEASDVPALRAQAKTTHQEIWTPILEYANEQLNTSPPAAAPEDGDLDTYRNFGNQLIPLAFACVISDDTEVCDVAKTYLLTYATWEQWGEHNQRDLGHAHMLLGNAMAYDWLYNHLTPYEQDQVRDSLAGWTQKIYEASVGPKNEDWNNWWHSSYAQNHHWTNNSALGIAGLALLGEDGRAQMWIDQATRQMSSVQHLLDWIEDGSWHEGIHYQGYGLTLSLPFMTNVRRIQGTDILPARYLRNYPYWRIYNYIPDTLQFILAYGDFEWGWSGYRAQNILRFIAQAYGDGHAEWMAQQLIAADGRYANVWSTPWYVFEFLYYDPRVQAQPPTDLKKARTFPDLGAVIWRTGWGHDDLIFGLKSGAYGGRAAFDTFTQEVYPWQPPCQDTGCQLNIGHDHDDTNGFYIYRSGYWLAPESEGVDKVATDLHNTLLIDGEGQYRPPEDHYGRYPEDVADSDGFLEATANTPHFDYVAADATRRYRHIDGIEDVTRYVVFVRPDYFVMLDNLMADSEHDYEWSIHFGDSVSEEGTWLRGDAGDGQILGVGIASPRPFETTLGNDGRPYARVRPASATENLRFIHILFPTDDDGWSRRPSVSVLDDTGKAVAIRVKMNDGSERVDDILISYAPSPAATAVGPYTYDGQVAVITRNDDHSINKLFMYGGTFLLEQATRQMIVVTTGKNGEAFEATYSDSTVTIHSGETSEALLYAPQARRLIVNGRPQPITRLDDFIAIGARAE